MARWGDRGCGDGDRAYAEPGGDRGQCRLRGRGRSPSGDRCRGAGAILDVSGKCVGVFTIAKHLTFRGRPTATLDAQGQGADAVKFSQRRSSVVAHHNRGE